MLKDNARLLCVLTLSLLLLSLAVIWRCSTADAAEIEKQTVQQEETVQVSLSKLIELQNLMNSQEQKINLLEQQLIAPMATLSEQQNLISELRENLQEAKNSLAKSELIISEQNKSLQSLSQTIRQDAKRTQCIERQRTLWQVLAVGTAAMLLKEKTT